MSTDTTLEARIRTGAGKGFARRTRAEGLIPAVVYGRHLEKPMSIAVDPKAMRAAINTPRKMNTLITLKVDGKAHTVLLKDYQMEPVSRAVLHADFIDVKESEQVKVRVPVLLTGKAEGVTAGGILSQMRRDIEVWALPAKIPEHIDIDVTNLKIGHSLHIKDVKLPEGVQVKSTVNYTMAVITAPEAEVVAAPVAAAAVPGAPGAAAAPGAPGAAAPGAPGAAAPAAAPAKADEKEEKGKKK